MVMDQNLLQPYEKDPMQIRIHKYPFKYLNQSLPTVKGTISRVIHFGFDNRNHLCVWVEEPQCLGTNWDGKEPEFGNSLHLEYKPTGATIPPNSRHVMSCIDPGTREVWHLYQQKEKTV